MIVFYASFCRLQTHFENVQKISDTTTLPFAMHYLRSRIMEELDISHLTEKLMHGKGESSAPALTPKEKYDTWEKIKILSTLLLILHGFVLHALLNFSLSNEL